MSETAESSETAVSSENAESGETAESSESAEPARTIVLVVCFRRWEALDKQRLLRPWCQKRPGHASRSPIVAVRLRFSKSYKPSM